jgi:hypothetical protein
VTRGNALPLAAHSSACNARMGRGRGGTASEIHLQPGYRWRGEAV